MSSEDKKNMGGRDKRRFGDKGKPPFRKKRDFGKKQEGGFQRREDGFGEKRDFGRKQEAGFQRREDGFGKKRDFGRKQEGGFQRREDGFGEKRDFGRKQEGGFQRREDGFGEKRFNKFRDRPEQKRPPRSNDSPFRGMYNGPRGPETPARGERPFRRSQPNSFSERHPRSEESGRGADSERERPHLAENELRYHGKNACLALWKQRPDDLVRVYVLREQAEEFSDLIEYCAKNRKSYHLVGPGDLERLSDSVHHQGICMVARAKSFYREEQFFRELGAHRTLVIYLDGVGNPHNLGAILRTCAHFGVKYVCVPEEAISKLSASIYRTAEGAAEVVKVVRIEDNEKFLDRLQGQGFHLYAFEPGEGSQSLFETRLNEKSVFVFGAEVEGISGIVRTIVETKITIPGTGAVESLNVSVAAAIAVAEFEKQSVQRTVRIVKPKP